MQKTSFSPFSYLATAMLSLALLSGCYTAQQNTKDTSNARSERQFRQEVVRYALQLRGTRYKYAGKTPRSGFDCSGFTSYVFKQFQIPVSSASSVQATSGLPVNLKNVQPGDLIIFGRTRRKIQHVAMVVERSRNGIIVVHSTTSRGVIRENISTSSYWKPRILHARNIITAKL